MTREEAIGRLEEEKGYYVSYLPAGKIIGKAEEWGKAIEAYEMAIEALKQEVEQFTYDEACIFLSAIEKERRAIKRMEAYIFGQDDKKNLNHIVDEIERKVQNALWEWER